MLFLLALLVFLYQYLAVTIIGDEGAFLFNQIGLGFIAGGLIPALLMPIHSFLILVVQSLELYRLSKISLSLASRF